jgi:hypothetical protein
MNKIIFTLAAMLVASPAFAQRIITKGATDETVELLIIDSADGTPETGVLYNTSGIDLWYQRPGAAKTSITEATLAALTTAHTDGGFLEIANGMYRLDLPDAAFATGVSHVTIGGTVTGMIVRPVTVQLTDADFQTALADATDVATEVWGTAGADPTVVPGVTATFGAKLDWLFAIARNRKTVTDALIQYFADDGSTVIGEKVLSDDDTTFTEAEATDP